VSSSHQQSNLAAARHHQGQVRTRPSPSADVHQQAAELADELPTNDLEAGFENSNPASDLRFCVGDAGFEPATSSV
jgi:hypothetical protein